MAVVAGGIGAAPFPLLFDALSRAGIAADFYLGGRNSRGSVARGPLLGDRAGRDRARFRRRSAGERGLVTEAFRRRAAPGRLRPPLRLRPHADVLRARENRRRACAFPRSSPRKPRWAAASARAWAASCREPTSLSSSAAPRARSCLRRESPGRSDEGPKSKVQSPKSRLQLTLDLGPWTLDLSNDRVWPSNWDRCELKNPILTASGTFGYGLEFTDFVDLSQARRDLHEGPVVEAARRQRPAADLRDAVGNVERDRPPERRRGGLPRARSCRACGSWAPP